MVDGVVEDELRGIVGPCSTRLQGFRVGVGWGKATEARRWMEDGRSRAGGEIWWRSVLHNYWWIRWQWFVEWKKFGGR